MSRVGSCAPLLFWEKEPMKNSLKFSIYFFVITRMGATGAWSPKDFKILINRISENGSRANNTLYSSTHESEFLKRALHLILILSCIHSFWLLTRSAISIGTIFNSLRKKNRSNIYGGPCIFVLKMKLFFKGVRV